MSIFGFPPIAQRGVAHFMPPARGFVPPPRGTPPSVFTPRPGPNYAAAAMERARLQRLQAQNERLRLEAEQRRMHQGAWRAQHAIMPPPPIAPVTSPVVTAPPPSPVVMPPSMPVPQPDVSPGNATQDMGPTQDAAAANADAALPPASASPGEPDEHPVHKYGRKLIIGLVVVGAGVGGYMLWKKSKKGGGGGGHAPKAHGMHGYRRRRLSRRR